MKIYARVLWNQFLHAYYECPQCRGYGYSLEEHLEGLRLIPERLSENEKIKITLDYWFSRSARDVFNKGYYEYLGPEARKIYDEYCSIAYNFSDYWIKNNLK
jgi:hypothetical protein